MLEEGYNDFRVGEVHDVSRGAAMRLLVTGWYREESRSDPDRRSSNRRRDDDRST
jgi:hypothetical protein